MSQSSPPPFSALRALEAASRHRSFTRAARELQVTHSAISQAVRRLEAAVGARLFNRRGGAMEPSDAALKLARTYSAAAEQLSDLLREIRGDEPANRLTVCMSPDVASLWMAGREHRLAEAMPDIGVVVTGDQQGAQSDVELLSTREPRATDRLLGPMVEAPVAAAALLDGPGAWTPARLAGLPLLSERPDGWSAWADRHLPGARLRPTVIRDRRRRLDAAIAGDGVMLADPLLAQGHLTAGALLQLPFPVETGSRLVLRPHGGRPLAAVIERLEMWLKLELARDAGLARKLPRSN